ncbi:Uncharacterised protein [Legionella steigerwaltii]|uniref:Uncharacterized protein n=1 Tax=Legionella steigerwaltii TaxID=460 RepID=A0A378LE66_9GAMM|nr:hypothetical protein Lstg_0561 [Legionella steigerwaltii]STY22381.1 Uncharacterised protein [Legionella steigerwaltii]
MLSKNMKKIIMICVLSGFISNSFAAWGYHRGYTVCRGGNCHHKSVNKGCINGHCGTSRSFSTWHR